MACVVCCNFQNFLTLKHIPLLSSLHCFSLIPPSLSTFLHFPCPSSLCFFPSLFLLGLVLWLTHGRSWETCSKPSLRRGSNDIHDSMNKLVQQRAYNKTIQAWFLGVTWDLSVLAHGLVAKNSPRGLRPRGLFLATPPLTRTDKSHVTLSTVLQPLLDA